MLVLWFVAVVGCFVFALLYVCLVAFDCVGWLICVVCLIFYVCLCLFGC